MTKITYNGTTYRLQSSGRYYQSDKKADAERLLHRRVWADHNGPIPEGMDVHHRDNDWRNNDPSNLEARPTAHHRSEHMHERWADPAQRIRFDEGLAKARLAAAEWHGSEVGRAWHSESAKATWAKRRPIAKICERCSAPFQAMMSDARYCSTACMQAVAFRRYFTETRNCAHCGKEFKANRHRKTACCSRTCANRRRAWME